jgi:hypothetical protein
LVRPWRKDPLGIRLRTLETPVLWIETLSLDWLPFGKAVHAHYRAIGATDQPPVRPASKGVCALTAQVSNDTRNTRIALQFVQAARQLICIAARARCVRGQRSTELVTYIQQRAFGVTA